MSKEILAGAYSGGGLRFKKNPQILNTPLDSGECQEN